MHIRHSEWCLAQSKTYTSSWHYCCWCYYLYSLSSASSSPALGLSQLQHFFPPVPSHNPSAPKGSSNTAVWPCPPSVPNIPWLPSALAINAKHIRLAFEAHHGNAPAQPSLALFLVAVGHVFELHGWVSSAFPLQFCLEQMLVPLPCLGWYQGFPAFFAGPHPWGFRTKSSFQETFLDSSTPAPRRLWCLFWTHGTLCYYFICKIFLN